MEDEKTEPRRRRGDGHLYRHYGSWCVQYYDQNQEKQREKVCRIEPGGRDKAEKFLKRRLREVQNHKDGLSIFVGASEYRTSIKEMIENLKVAAQIGRVGYQQGISHILEFFGRDKAFMVTSVRIDRYIKARLQAGAKPSTINHEMTTLRNAFQIAIEAGTLNRMPKFTKLPEENVREGFVTKGQHDFLLECLPDDDLRDFVDFLFHSAWRKGEAATLTWKNVDLERGQIILPGRRSKNGVARPIPVVANILRIIERRLSKRQLNIDFVFHRFGLPIGDIRCTWDRARKKAGLPDLLIHDLRRSGIVNMRRAGVPEKVIMLISGHQTREVFDRYSIVDDSDVAEALRKTAEYYDSLSTLPAPLISFPRAESK